METLQKSAATPESVWAMFQETDRMFQETRRIMQENAQAQKKSRANFEKSRANFDREMQEIRRIMQELAQSQKETDRKMQETDRKIKEVSQTVGGMGNSQGEFAEEYFFNAFENGKQNFFGEKFDEIRKNIKGIEQDDEYDILLINGKYIGIVEVKYKARETDIPKVLRKAETFRENFPKYQHHKIYLALASMSFYPEVEEACISAGIAIIKQVGETVVICDEHLKVF